MKSYLQAISGRFKLQVIADAKVLVPQSSIVVTGYAIPSSPLTWHPSPECSSSEAMRRLNSLLRRAAELESVTFVNVSERMGGNATAWSEPSFFLASRRDQILACIGEIKQKRSKERQESFRIMNKVRNQDEIHLNAAGYEHLWSMPEMQRALGCTVEISIGEAPEPSMAGFLLTMLWAWP